MGYDSFQLSGRVDLARLFTKVTAPGVLSKTEHELDILQFRDSLKTLH